MAVYDPISDRYYVDAASASGAMEVRYDEGGLASFEGDAVGELRPRSNADLLKLGYRRVETPIPIGNGYYAAAPSVVWHAP